MLGEVRWALIRFSSQFWMPGRADGWGIRRADQYPCWLDRGTLLAHKRFIAGSRRRHPSKCSITQLSDHTEVTLQPLFSTGSALGNLQ
eukprot:scaffold258852_cov19-Tisochrysis_lutea.AAC.1